MRVDVEQLRGEIQPLADSVGVELVALEWLQSPGRGVLRLYIDRPGGDPRVKPDDANPGTTADQCAAVSHAVSALLDDGDRIEVAYDLEVSSPGFDRPVQQRKDFDRFAGLEIKVRTRGPLEGKTSFEGTLMGTAGDGDEYTVRVSVGGHEVVIPRRQVSRARLAEIKAPKPVKPGKGPKAPRPPKTEEVAQAPGDESPDAGR